MQKYLSVHRNIFLYSEKFIGVRVRINFPIISTSSKFITQNIFQSTQKMHCILYNFCNSSHAHDLIYINKQNRFKLQALSMKPDSKGSNSYLILFCDKAHIQNCRPLLQSLDAHTLAQHYFSLLHFSVYFCCFEMIYRRKLKRIVAAMVFYYGFTADRYKAVCFV